MVTIGDTAPAFTAPFVRDDVAVGSLDEYLPHDAPVVLAFFPGAFTRVCTDEMRAFEAELDAFEDAGATVLGVSVDTPFALEAFRERHDLSFGLVSDAGEDIVAAYGVADEDFSDLGYTTAKRAVFVVDADGVVTYRWVTDDPGVEPDYDAVAAAAAEAAD